MKYLCLLLVNYIFVLLIVDHVSCKSMVPVLSLEQTSPAPPAANRSQNLKYLPFIMLIDKDMDTSEYWRETEILSLVRNNEIGIDYDKCEQTAAEQSVVRINSFRTVRPICRNTIDYQQCPQCPHFNNHTECELFRDSCKERRVSPTEYRTYCDRKYGKWRAMFLPADYSQCRCCDECIFFRELDQSCVEDEYSFETEEFLPTTTIGMIAYLVKDERLDLYDVISSSSASVGCAPKADIKPNFAINVVDFRAGCNPYWGHPEQEFRALRCDKILRRCVPVTVPPLPNETFNIRRSFRYEAATSGDCPIFCRGYECKGSLVPEQNCVPGGFLPDKDQCNCCGRCSVYHQLNEKCAEFKKTFQKVNGTVEIEVRVESI
uniref:SFRICE_001356 n=1 Tax=Spodoptera frugiperda TaxID=7108 RepID=A0A2H1V8Q9_SPOFR